MENIEIKINKKTREVNPKQIFIGLDGENLQENVIFSFEDEFVDGQARIEVEFRDGTKGQITDIQKFGDTYVLPIKSEITKYSGCIAQLVITEGTDENSVPIFKSMYVGLIVAESINATTPIPEGYTEWIDSANAKLNQIDEKIEEVDTAVEQVNNAVERVDEGLSDLTHANEEAREIVSNFESNVEQYTTDFNTNADNKTNSFNSNYESKLRSFDSNASDKTTTFNNNADSKLSSYNSNANSKIGEYNSNAETKKTNYDINASSKLNEYNTNATTKLGDYNTNATTKLEEYNTNASTKLEEYNQNASEKIVEYDNHVAEMQNTINKLEDRVDDLEDNQIIKSAEGTTIALTDAHSTRLNSFEMTKESTQYTTTGNCLEELTMELGTIDQINGTNQNHSNQVRCNGYIDVSQNRIISISKSNNVGVTIGYKFYDVDKNYLGNVTSATNVLKDIDDFTLSNTTSYYSSNDDIYYARFNVPNTNDLTIKYSVMKNITNWEEYTGGIPAPNPDYPQEVNVVEGYRNLFESTLVNNGTNIAIGNGTVTLEEDTFVLTATGTDLFFGNVTNAGGSYTDNIGILMNVEGLSSVRFYVSNPLFKKNFITAYDENKISLGRTQFMVSSGIYNVPTNTKYIAFRFGNGNATVGTTYETKVMITNGTQELPYVPYGNNYIAVNVSDGNTTNSYPILLNNNIIVGIGDYKDELIVDKTGHVFINKKYLKYVFTGNETIQKAGTTLNNIFQYLGLNTTILTPPNNNSKVGMLSNYFIENDVNSFYSSDLINIGVTRSGTINIGMGLQGGIDTVEKFTNFLEQKYTQNNPVYLLYPLATPQLIDLQTTVDLRLFKGTNNISNSEDGYMTIDYVVSNEILLNSLESRIIALEGE